MSMVAYRIIPDWLDGSLLCARLFLISALPDGTTQLRLLAGRGLEEQHTVELPGGAGGGGGGGFQGGGFEGGGFGGGWKRGGDGGMVDEVNGQVRRLPVPKSSYSRVPLTRAEQEKERRRGAGKRRAGDVCAGVRVGMGVEKVGGEDGTGGSFGGAGMGADGMEEDATKEEVLGAGEGGEGTEGHEGWMMDGDGCAEERGGENTGEGGRGGEERGEGRGGGKGGRLGGAAEEVPEWAYGLEGLWTGEYGPHGVEILNVLVQGGEIVATKITGDPNVPCGQVTFKARLATAQGPPDPSDLPPTDSLLPRGPGGLPMPLTPTRSIVIPPPSNAGDESAGRVEGSSRGEGRGRGGGSSAIDGSDTAMGDGDGDCDGGDVDRAAERERERAEEARRERGERWQRATTLARAVMHTDHDAGADEGTEVQFVWMCQGQGRVADYNFRRPQWVNGCLLVDSAARITFLWQDVHFAIRFRRLDLPKLVHSA
ncbi:unnamed protein product [Closterium sp. Yama58-4]|nr:unnamed protein product [Closterium sp. Yama58-4]